MLSKQRSLQKSPSFMVPSFNETNKQFNETVGRKKQWKWLQTEKSPLIAFYWYLFTTWKPKHFSSAVLISIAVKTTNIHMHEFLLAELNESVPKMRNATIASLLRTHEIPLAKQLFEQT